MKDYPLVSIIFITFKRINLLKQTFDSFKSNTEYPSIEYILCDDGSPEFIQKEMKKLPFDKFLFSKKNEGIGANTNKGIIEASGEFIFQMQDDWIYTGKKGFLESGVEALQTFPDLGIVRYRVCESEKFPEEKEHYIGLDNNVRLLKEKFPYESGWGKLYSDTPHLKRKNLHKEVGYYLEIKNMEKTEIDFCYRISRQDIFKVGYIDGYKEVFEHIGEKESLRTKKLKAKIAIKLSESTFGNKIFKYYKKIKSYLN